MPNSLEIVNLYDTRYEQAWYAWNSYIALAEQDLRMYLGNQWNNEEKRKLFEEGRNAYVFNRIKRNTNLVEGYQRSHRLSSIILPQEDKDQRAADDATDLILKAMTKGDAFNVISDCFAGALRTGWNLNTIWMDYREDPVNGDIKFGREPYSGFITDPYFTQKDLSDCGYIIRRKYVTYEQANSLLPGHSKELERLAKQGWSRDDKFPWLPYQTQPSGLEMLAYNEFYIQKWKDIPLIVDTETGEYTEWPGSEADLKAFVAKFPQLKVVKKPQAYTECHIIINDAHIKTTVDQYGLNTYPFVPFFAYFVPEANTWDLKIQSLVRCMVDPQIESNRRRSQMTDILESQLNSGWMAKKEAVINPHSLYRSGQGEVIWKTANSQPGDLEKIPPAQIPPSFFQLQELFDRDMVEISGLNDAAFGQPANAQESGIMMMLRQSASLVSLQDLFDNLRLSQKKVTEKVLELVRTWTPEKVQRILGREPAPELFDKDFIKYDISIQEGMLTDTQKQMYFRQLVDLKQLGVPVTGEMLAKAAPIQGKTQLMEELAQMEQAQAQAAQAQQQLQMQQLNSASQAQQARAISDIALSKERFTRAIANIGLSDERSAKAVDDRSSAALDRAKAMKELSSMDDERLIKYLSIVRMMEEMNKVKEQEIKTDDVALAAKGQEIGDQITNAAFPQMQQEQQPL